MNVHLCHMATGEDTMLFIRGQLHLLGDDITVRKMMGEYVLHYRGRVLGFISNDVLILEDGPTIRRLLPQAEHIPLFPGSKDFIIFPDPGNSHLLCEVVKAIYDDLPLPKPRKSKAKHTSGGPSNKSDAIEDFLEFRRSSKP